MRDDLADVVLERFGVSATHGFLPRHDPLCRLPESFAAWDAAVAGLAASLCADTLERELADLSPIDVSVLTTRSERERLMLVLSYLAHAYVFGGDRPRGHIPAVIAEPWTRIAAELSRPPVLSYASHVLWNWRRMRPEGPIALGNLARIERFYGGLDDDWFVLVHVAIEATAGRALASAARAAAGAARGDADQVSTALHTVAGVLDEMTAVLGRMPEKCDPYVFFHRVRRFIFGWQDNPGLPDGVRYLGQTPFGTRPQWFRGETGAQSSIVAALDGLLGIQFREDDPLARHLHELRRYMPAEHRDFIAALARASVRPFVFEHRSSARIRDAYNRCLAGLYAFRKLHLDYARTYIARQSHQTPANPTATGTGGTPFMTYLRQHLRDVQQQHIA